MANTTGGLFATENDIHRTLDNLHDAGISDESMFVVGPEVQDIDMRFNDSDMDNMVEDGDKLRRWGQRPTEWHFENGDAGIMLTTTYQNEGVQGLQQALERVGFDNDRAATLAEGVDDGNTMIGVFNIQADKHEQATSILIESGAAAVR